PVLSAMLLDLGVSVDRAVRPSPHTRGKPRLLDVGRRILARDRFAPDSPLEGDGFELPVRGSGEAGCGPFSCAGWLGRVGVLRFTSFHARQAIRRSLAPTTSTA